MDDNNNWLTKKLGEIITAAIFIIILTMLFIYALCFAKIEKSFWDNAMGDILTTIIALIAGIPTALWVDRRIKSGEESRKYISDRRREKNLLELIKEELEFSYKSLFVKGKKGNKISITIQPLKSDLWDALVSSDETKYIEEPNLLNRISSAYYVLKIVKNIEEHAYIASRTSAIRFTLPDGTRKSAARLLLEDARNFDSLFENNIKMALRIINKRINKLQNYGK